MQKKENKILSFIKNNKFYILAFIFSFFILFLLMNQVVMYADDFGLKIKSEQSFGYLLKYLVHNYVSWGGGHTPLLVTILFKFGFNTWKVINTLIITTMFFLIAKTISNDFKHFLVYFFIIWILFYCIDISILRECVYWLDGSMAYVVSTFELFMFIYILYTRFLLEKEKKYDVLLVPLISFFSGWSGAQTSGITLILCILFFIWYKFIKHNKINKRFLLLMIPAFLGIALFFLSPGNGLRMTKFPLYFNLGFVDKILYRISDCTNLTFNFKQYSFFAMPLFVFGFSYLILFLSINQLQKNGNKKEKLIILISTIFQFIFLALTIIMNFASKETILNYIFKFVNLYELKVNNQLSIINFIPYFAIIFFLICNLITIIIHSKNEKNYLLLILFVAIYGSQYSMMLAPYTPLRTCLTAIIFLIFAIIYLINYLKDQHFDFIKIVPIIFMYINFNIAIILYIFIDILLLNKNMKKLLLILSIVPFSYFSAYIY